MSEQAPLACFVVGPAGSGKSTVARSMARAARAVLLDKDSLGEEFVDELLKCAGHEHGERESNQYYRTNVMPLEYRALFRVAGENLRLQNNVVIDAPFSAYLESEGYLEQMTAAADWPNVRKVVAHVQADKSVVHARLQQRGLWRDRWKLSHWDEFWETFASTQCLWSSATQITIANSGAQPDLCPWLSLVNR